MHLQLDSRGSITVEGLAAMLVFFVVVTLIVQIGFLVVARNATSLAVDAAVRRAAIDPESVVDHRVRLHRDLEATVPGTRELEVHLTVEGTAVEGSVSFEWMPPGPDLLPIRVAVERSARIVVPP